MRIGFKTLAAALAVALTTSFVATDANADAKYRVAYIARSQRDSFAAWLANSIVTEAKKYPDVTLTVFDGQSRSEVLQSLIENAVQNKFDLTIIQSHDPAIQIGPVKAAIAQGMRFVATNPKFDDESIPYVDANPYQQGGENAKLALTQVPKNAQVVVLLGPAANPHSVGRRTAWQKEFFDKRPDVKILDEQIANWNKDEAMNFMEDWVQANPKIDAIVSMNDNMAAGALEVVKNNPKYKGIFSYGVDGTAEACLLIKNGQMTSTCLQSAYALAEKLMDTTEKLVNGKSGQINVDIDAPLVTKANVDGYIAMHKKAGAIK